MADLFDAVAEGKPDLFDEVAGGDVFDQISATPPPIDLDPIANAYGRVQMQTGLRSPESTANMGEVGDSELLRAIGSDPKAFVKAIPDIVFGAAAAPGKLAYNVAADVIANTEAKRRAALEKTGEENLPPIPEYGGNIEAMMAGKERTPAENLISSSASAAPNTAITANLAKAAPELISMVAVNPTGLPGRLLALGFSGQMIKDVGPLATELGNEMGKPPEQQDAGKIAELKAGLLQTAIFAPLAAAHGIPIEAAPKSGSIGPIDNARYLADRVYREQVNQARQEALKPESGRTMGTELQRPVNLPKEPIKEVSPNASTIPSPASLPEYEIRPPVGEATPLRQPGEAAEAQGGEPARVEPAASETPQEVKAVLPVLVTDSGKVYPGTSHADALDRAKEMRNRGEISAEDYIEAAHAFIEDSQHKFQTADGKILDRAEAGKYTGLGGKLQSERLADKGLLLPVEKTSEPTPATPQGKILAAPETTAPAGAAEKSIASDWTSATEESQSPVEQAPSKAATPEKLPIMELHSGIPIPKFENRKMSPLDRITSIHSGKIQKSFDEARRAQKEIRKEVPTDRRQAAISVWREAKGDVPTLQSWASLAKGKEFKQAAIDAQSLTPKELAIANKAIAAFDVLEKRGNKFDVLQSHRDNYIPHVWDVKKPGGGFGGSMLKQRFKFSKARTFNTFFDGDQAGFKPRTLAIGKLLPAYIHEMNTVIADRQFVRDLAATEAKDGAPLAVPRGSVKTVDDGKAVLVQPKAMREADTTDYRMMPDQPALSKWTWEGKDTDGKPVFVKADLALHPEAYRRLQAIIGRSAIKEWYREPVVGAARIPRAAVQALDVAQSAMKREMFGLLAPFHQVQEGTHAVGHLVNPFFGIPKVDLRDAAQLDAANHGLMLLPDRASASTYLEGVGAHASLLSRGIRHTGKAGETIANVIDGYQDYLFHQYIPGLKFKTYEAMLGRNMKRYAPELASGEMTPSDVKITTAEQANAAYGHLNFALLDRNPTIQHMIQMSLLAPDFLEARARFTGQAFKGLSSKVGTEQLKAIAILAAAQAGSAFVLSNLLGTPYDPKHPFEVIYKGRRYSMRSVPEDIYGFLKDRRQFIYSRVNPLTVRGGIQLATGLNYRGEKVTPLETVEELLAGYIPITARQIPGIRSLTETGRNNPVTPLQQLAGSLGLRISRYSPISETYKLAGKWKEEQKIPQDTGSYPVSKYQQLRYALEDGDLDRARSEYHELRKAMAADKIADGFRESVSHPFTGSRANDAKFFKTLKGYDAELYKQALITRSNILKGFSYIQHQ